LIHQGGLTWLIVTQSFIILFTRYINQQVVAQRRLLVTTNYIIAELVALLTSRSRIPRQQIVLFIDTLKTTPHIEVIHIDLDLDAVSWTLLKAHAIRSGRLSMPAVLL
jgi:predicted nucleic acid-binding protein